MEQSFTIFEYRFNNEELEEEFNNFFHRYNLDPLFTNEHRSSGISVTYVDARSVINTGGSYHKTLKRFTDYLLMANDNKSYEEAIFKIIYEARSFQGLINTIKNLMRSIDSDIETRHRYNQWNIVWYNKEMY